VGARSPFGPSPGGCGATVGDANLAIAVYHEHLAERVGSVRLSLLDPSVFVRVAAGLLALDANDELAAEATAAAPHR
jgi:hypothetical protein